MFMPGFLVKPNPGPPPSFSNTKSLTCASASNYLSRTQGAGTSRRKTTISCWVKTPSSFNSDYIYLSLAGGVDGVFFDSTGAGVVLNTAADGYVTTSGFTPSISTWYHVLVQIDTANATAGNRCKIYIDGTDVTGTPSVAITQNYDTNWGASGVTETTASGGGAASWLIDEIARFDNQLYSPSDVRDSGTVKPKDLSALTFGAQGSWLRFETGVIATVGNDSSGNGNNFTNTGFVVGDFSSTVP